MLARSVLCAFEEMDRSRVAEIPDLNLVIVLEICPMIVRLCCCLNAHARRRVEKVLYHRVRRSNAVLNDAGNTIEPRIQHAKPILRSSIPAIGFPYIYLSSSPRWYTVNVLKRAKDGIFSSDYFMHTGVIEIMQMVGKGGKIYIKDAHFLIM